MFVPIAERVYGIKVRFGSSPFSVWAYAVTDPGSRRLLLVDSGGLGSGRPIMHAIQALGYSPRDVVGIAITHWHGDHTGGICELLDVTDHPVTIYGGAADLDVYLAQKPLPLKVRPSWFVPRGLQISHRPGKVSGRDGISYVHLAPDNARTALVEWGIEAIPTPGHTAGHTAYQLPAGRAMFCGDALFRLGGHLYTLGFYDDLVQMDSTARWLLNQEFDWLLPAHVSPLCERIPLSARQNVGGRAVGAVRLLERLSAFRYQGTVGR